MIVQPPQQLRGHEEAKEESVPSRVPNNRLLHMISSDVRRDSMAEVTPDSIFQIASGFMAAKHLFVANEVGLFEHLAAGAATLNDLAQRLGLPRRTTRMVADAMVALGLVQRAGEHYQNAPVAATFLSGRTPTDVGPILRQFNRLSYPRWAHLEEAVRTGKAVFGEFAFTADEQQVYSEGVEAITGRNRPGTGHAV
jgi:hypothetical protein